MEQDEPFHEFIACFLSQRDFSELYDIEYHIERVKTKLLENGADMDAPCSASSDSVCWLLDSLDSWNAILYQGGLGLYEDKYGILTCKIFQLSYCNADRLALESACLFYRLFEYHRCVQRLVISDTYPLLKRRYWPPLLKLSLEASKGLHSIDVASSLDGGGRCSVLDAAPNISNLQEITCTIKPNTADYLHEALRLNGRCLIKLNLECAAITTEDLLAGLKFCSCLRELELSSLEINVAVFVDFLTSNTSISRLVISDVSSRAGSVEEGMASALEANSVLEVLALSLRGGDATHIAESLCMNSTLRFLSLENFGNLAFEGFARMLVVNESLVELRLSAHLSYLDAGSLIEGIVSNKTLKYLHVSTSHTESVLRLVEALKLNTTLCSLHVDGISRNDEVERLVEMAALQPWALERVVTTWSGNCCHDLAHTINTGGAPTSLEVLYPMYRNLPRYDGLVDLLRSLRSNQSVTSFSLAGFHPFGETISCHLGRMFTRNKALEVVQISKLCLEDSDDASHLRFICSGLVRNTSIRRLQLVFYESDPNVLTHLAAVAEKNRYITCLDLYIEVKVDRSADAGSLFDAVEWMHAYTLFSSAIEMNIDLLEARLRVFSTRNVIEFDSDYRLTVQRNLCALNRAVRFVLMPTVDRRAAEVFQEYEQSPGLVRALKESEETCDSDVVRLVRSASNFIACHFFVITGIVKMKVQCETHGDTRLQLGDLNEMCLCKIASYLKVRNVLS